MMTLPLEGIRILEHGEAYAASMASGLLADMGAEVIDVEAIQHLRVGRGVSPRPPRGTPGLPGGEPGARPWDRQAGYNGYNRNKLCITLDLTRPRGQELYLRLLRIVDVVVENYSARSAAKLGLTYERLHQLKPDLIMLSLSGFGRSGPYRSYGTFGRTIDAMTGDTALRGYPGDDPTIRTTAHVYPDNVAGATGAFALLAALHYRQRTGLGQYIDLSQAEAFMLHVADAILEYTFTGRVPQPLGNKSPSLAPHGCYPCRGEDQWVTIAVRHDADWSRLCAALGNPLWCQEPHFAEALGRYRHQEEIDRHLETWTRERSAAEVTRLLQQHGVPAAPVMEPPDLYQDPHLRERGFFVTLTHREAGTHAYPGVPWKLTRTPNRIRLPAPCLGEHNEYVFGELLGLSTAEREELAVEWYLGDTFLEDAHLSAEDKGRT